MLLLGLGAFGLASSLAAEADHWAFQSLAPVEPPSVRQSAWVKTPVDRFILAALEAQGLQPSPAATREQLIRRLSFGLTGLPPSLKEIDSFAEDSSPAAYENLVDRLLASPAYGERWARHWLDVARYAESDGFEHDAVRPYSWRYREYVIESFNADKPYDRFVQEQIAGDELWPDRPEALVATGFNLLGPDMVDSADQTQRRLNTLNDMTDTMAFAIMGVTLGCARCHDHKFEPFTQRDYFSLQAFFTPARFHRERAVPTPAQREAHEEALRAYRLRTSETKRAIRELEAPCRMALYEAKLARLSEDAQLAHRTAKEERSDQQEATVAETASQVKVSDAEVLQALSSSERARRQEWLNQIKGIPEPAPLPMAMVLENAPEITAKTFVLLRGDYNNPGEEVQPAFPSVVQAARPAKPKPQGRAALARWLTSPENPLTARVMVNRVWQHHFGRGLVSTPNDLGTRGAAPTHPELLDWLAAEFIRNEWSLKKLHKLILLSAAYQQSSEAAKQALARDPDNRLYSRQNKGRLEGEAVRDSLLAISGRLDPAMGGPSVWPPIPGEMSSKNWNPPADPTDSLRRSVYIFSRRNVRFPFLEVFDAPDSNLSCAVRGQSVTAPQSLTLLNSEAVVTAAAATAERIVRGASNDAGRMDVAFRLVLGRHPSPAELEVSRAFLTETKARLGEEIKETGLEEWSELCRALFNLNAFVYVD